MKEDFCLIFHIVSKDRVREKREVRKGRESERKNERNAFNRRDRWFVVVIFFLFFLNLYFNIRLSVLCLSSCFALLSYPIVFSIIEHNDRFFNRQKKSHVKVIGKYHQRKFLSFFSLSCHEHTLNALFYYVNLQYVSSVKPTSILVYCTSKDHL